MELLKHNDITYNQLKNHIDKREDCCIVNPCGSGKSSVIASVIRDNTDKTILLITRQANASDYYNSMSDTFTNISIMTYNKLHSLYKSDRLSSLKDTDICIFDEAHYIGAEKWYKSVSELRKVSNCISIGVTATPQRYEDRGTGKTIVTEFSNNIVGNFTVKQLQKDGVFTEPDYIVSIASIDSDIENYKEGINESDLTESKKLDCLERLDNIKKDWEENYSPDIVIRDNLHKYLYKKSGNKILVFCKNSQAIKKDKKFIMGILRKNFPRKRIKAYDYTYKSNEKVFNEFLNDESNYINVLFSIDKVCETVHIPDLSILIFLRSSYSNRIITQQIGRLNNIGNKNKGIIIDMVNNISRYKESISAVTRTKNERSENSNRVRLNYNISYISRTISIFNSIDKILSKSYYTYKNFRGSLKQVCYVFRRNYDKVKSYIEMGYDIEDAFDLVPYSGKYNLKSSSRSELLDIDYDFTLTDEEKELVDKYTDVAKEMLSKKNCNDEDILADCYLYLCYLVHVSYNEYKGYRLNQNIKLRLLKYIIGCIRSKYDEIYNVDYLSENLTYRMEEPIISSCDKQLLYDLLLQNIYKLKDKEAVVLAFRFGLDDILEMHGYKSDNDTGKTLECVGKILGLKGSNVRDIEQRAIRKLYFRFTEKKGFLHSFSD